MCPYTWAQEVIHKNKIAKILDLGYPSKIHTYTVYSIGRRTIVPFKFYSIRMARQLLSVTYVTYIPFLSTSYLIKMCVTTFIVY